MNMEKNSTENNSPEKKSRKIDVKKFFAGSRIWQIILGISVLVMVVSGVRIYQLSREYSEGIEEYQELEQYVTIAKEPVAETADDTQEEAAGSEEATTESKIAVNVEVDYAGLIGINKDFAGWLYYEPLELSYPIVRGNDNDYYTHYTFENTKNSSGAIFMDFLNKVDLTDYNTIIYGHNMRNGTMFGSLKKLLNDEEMIANNPYFYILTEDKTLQYQIFASYITKEDSDTYQIIRNEEEQKTYLDFIASQTELLDNVEVTQQDRVVTLSTCNGLHSTNRTIIHGVLVAEEENAK